MRTASGGVGTQPWEPQQQQQQQQEHELQPGEQPDALLSLCQEGLYGAVTSSTDRAYMLHLAAQLGVTQLADRQKGAAPDWEWLMQDQDQQQQQQQQAPKPGSLNMYAWMQRLRDRDQE